MTERITEGSTVLEHVGDPGIVVFGKSMHVTYVNDRARQFFDCAKGTSTSVPPQDDLMFQIVKSVAGIRDRLYSELETGSRADASDEITISTACGALPHPGLSGSTDERRDQCPGHGDHPQMSVEAKDTGIFGNAEAGAVDSRRLRAGVLRQCPVASGGSPTFMLELLVKLFVDVVALAAIIGLLLTWLWEKTGRTQAAESSESSEPGRSSGDKSGRRDSLQSPLRKAG
jgi:hypothetical protein